jgi:hypothetical protein
VIPCRRTEDGGRRTEGGGCRGRGGEAGRVRSGQGQVRDEVRPGQIRSGQVRTDSQTVRQSDQARQTQNTPSVSVGRCHGQPLRAPTHRHTHTRAREQALSCLCRKRAGLSVRGFQSPGPQSGARQSGANVRGQPAEARQSGAGACA